MLAISLDYMFMGNGADDEPTIAIHSESEGFLSWGASPPWEARTQENMLRPCYGDDRRRDSGIAQRSESDSDALEHLSRRLEEGDENGCGEWNTTGGAEPADVLHTMLLLDNGFKVTRASSCRFRHHEHDIVMIVVGDDFVSNRNQTYLQWA